MHTYISMLRGINVSGKNSIKMDALRELYTKLGFQDAQSYIQSGNVVFKTAETDPQFLQERIKQAISVQFGYDVPVLVIDQLEYAAIIKSNPYLNDESKQGEFMHLTLLAEQPDPEKLAKIDVDAYLPDCFEVLGRTIYLYCPGGYGNTKLNNGFFESKLKIAATTRNWKTSQHLLSLCHCISTRFS